jgi:hypothetical protein
MAAQIRHNRRVGRIAVALRVIGHLHHRARIAKHPPASAPVAHEPRDGVAGESTVHLRCGMSIRVARVAMKPSYNGVP